MRLSWSRCEETKYLQISSQSLCPRGQPNYESSMHIAAFVSLASHQLLWVTAQSHDLLSMSVDFGWFYCFCCAGATTSGVPRLFITPQINQMNHHSAYTLRQEGLKIENVPVTSLTELEHKETHGQV